ncbi:HEAT repeat domain-containing protein [Corallococcus interemptor]|uniref:HEAT repeat domain-containing protein n=1 Tax=Corallococcus interemptor TaxID=2316720 RepID=UPI003D003BEF
MARSRRRLLDGDAAGLAKLEGALRGEDPDMAPHVAADTLARYREGLRLLTRIIASPGDPRLREAAVYGFVFAQLAPQHLVLLRRIYANPNEAPGVRSQAAEALGSHYSNYRHTWQRRYRRVIDLLVRGLDDPEPEIRFWSIYALAGHKDPRIRPKLQAIAQNDTATVPGMWSLRQEALWALGWGTDVMLRDPRSL